MRHDNAPLRRTYGPLAARIARLIGIRPGLARRLFCAPTRVTHAIGAFLHLAAPADDDELARRLDEADPRVLLREVFPDASPRLFRTLDRLGDAVRSADVYRRVGAISVGPHSEALFASNADVDDRLLQHLEGLAEADEAIRLLPARLLVDPAAIAAVGSVLALLRAHGRNPAVVLADLPSRARLNSVEKRLREAVSTIEGPPLTVSPPSGFQHVMTVRELRAIGRNMKLCVAAPMHSGAEHWLRLLSGRSVYLICTEPVALIELRQVGPNLWQIGEARREANRVVVPSMRKAITTKLRKAGWLLIETDPAECLVLLASRTDADFAEWDRSIGAVLADLEHEWS
jgi:hypothetical protein